MHKMKFLVFRVVQSSSRSTLRDLKKVIKDYVSRGFVVLTMETPANFEIDVKMQVFSEMGVFGEFDNFESGVTQEILADYTEEPPSSFVENCLSVLRDMLLPSTWGSNCYGYDPVHCGILESSPYISFTVRGRRVFFTDILPSRYISEQIRLAKSLAGDNPAIITSAWGVDADEDLSAEGFQMEFNTSEDVEDVALGIAYNLTLDTPVDNPVDAPADTPADTPADAPKDASSGASWLWWWDAKKED